MYEEYETHPHEHATPEQPDEGTQPVQTDPAAYQGATPSPDQVVHDPESATPNQSRI